MNDAFNFDDLTPAEVPVRIGGKDYILREASGGASVIYRNAQLKATRMGPDGKFAGIDNMADAEPLLVSLCLFERYEQGGQVKERPVPIQTIRGWPSRVMRGLYDWVVEVSQLGEKETAAVLQKRLADTQEKLDALANGNGEDPGKNAAASMTAGSDLPTN